MNKIEKLLQKIKEKDRRLLSLIIEDIISGKDIAHLKPIKLQGLELYRIRRGNFRIIFHKEDTKYIIDSIKIRDDGTYKNL